MSPLPRLPQLLKSKIYKTGQTRGADDDVIYQNRVGRNSTVVIPYPCWGVCRNVEYENSCIVMLSPTDYFADQNITQTLAAQGLTLGENALVFYETRAQWLAHNPEASHWTPAVARQNPLGGQYVARIPATTADNTPRIIHGFSSTANKGAGIRVYEYASTNVLVETRIQLEACFWLCRDAEAVATRHGMTQAGAAERKAAILGGGEQQGLVDRQRLRQARIINRDDRTICPLCLDELSAEGFFNRLVQAEGRVVPDLTVTQLNLFHIEELRYGVLNHRPYNLGWGHHHCNVVVKDAGIQQTIEWMETVLNRNRLVAGAE
jgi:hypothetical protein